MCNSMAQALTNEIQLQNGLCIYFSVSLLSSCLRKYSCSLAMYQFCLGHTGDFGMMIKCCVCCSPANTWITGACNILTNVCVVRNSQAVVIMTTVAAPTASEDIQNPFKIFNTNSLMITVKLIWAVGMSAKYVMVHEHLRLMLASYPQMYQCSLPAAMRVHQPMNI